MTKTIERLHLRISHITQLTPSIRFYQLRAASCEDLPLISAGSHIAIPVTLANGKADVQHHFICSNPNQREFYEIAIHHEQNTLDDSQTRLEDFTLGSLLECTIPTNNFHLHADASPAILIAESIGITALIAIAHTLTARGRRFNLHYAGSRKTEMAFIDELQKNFPRNTHVYAVDEDQPIDIMSLLAEAPSNTLFYACCTAEMLTEIETCARMIGITKDRIQTEHLPTEKIATDKAVVLELAYSDKFINVHADQSLLTALRTAGVNTQFDCCVGDCGTCAVKILAGEAEHRDHVLSDAQKAQGFICVCVSRAKSEKLVLAL